MEEKGRKVVGERECKGGGGRKRRRRWQKEKGREVAEESGEGKESGG